jgi:hypothetical protein
MKTVFIHIGAHKTGTTAIQYFLSSNREVLKQKGYLYPGDGIAHHPMVGDFRTLKLPEISVNPACETNNYFREIKTAGISRIILSSEEFETLDWQQINVLKEFLLPGYLVKIIFYIRRQDNKIESMYNASIKNPTLRSDLPFPAFFTDLKERIRQNKNGGSHTPINFGNPDYYSVLLPWKEAFGKENILVRCYEDEQLPEGIFNDFMNITGMGQDNRFTIPKSRMNESLSWDLIEIIRICNSHFRDDPGFHDFLLQNLTLINAGKNKGHLLSPGQRRDIISLFEESNAKVAREYLGRDDGRLFYSPPPDLNEPWEPHEDLTVERIIPVFTQMLLNLDNTYNKKITRVRNKKPEY